MKVIQMSDIITTHRNKWHHFTGIRLGPHQLPLIECENCGHKHHIDCTTGEQQGHCTECQGFLRRPTDTEQKQFTEFYVWNSEWTMKTEMEMNNYE